MKKEQTENLMKIMKAFLSRIDNLSKEAADKIAAEINVCGGEAFVGKN